MKGDSHSIKALQDLLQSYQSASGQIFNIQKSLLKIGKCGSRRKRKISSSIGIQESPAQLTYLGIPIVFGTPKKSHFLPLMDRINKRLQVWKSKLLSFAGRLILIRHVLSSMAIHLAATLPLPASTCNALERVMRKFLWSGSANSSKFNYVNWSTVTLPKSEGGLGIRRLPDVNAASFIKLGWQASTGNSIWASWFKSRYFNLHPIWSLANTKHGSSIWKKIKKLAPHIKQGTTWTFGNGQDINVWNDPWIDNLPLADRFPDFTFPQDQKLSSLFQSGSWIIPPHLPPAIQSFLSKALSPLSPVYSSKDSLRWRDSPDGQLTLKAAWHQIRSRSSPLEWPPFIWNSINLHKISCFGWRLMHNKTPTEIRLKRLGFSLASRCNICCREEDSQIHLFFSCEQAKAIWTWLCLSAKIDVPRTLSVSSIWEALSSRNDLAGKRLMASVFTYVIFFRWKARNEATFKARKIPLPFLQQQIQEYLSTTLRKINKPFCGNQLRSLLLFLKLPTG